jgi:hypothetical protein
LTCTSVKLAGRFFIAIVLKLNLILNWTRSSLLGLMMRPILPVTEKKCQINSVLSVENTNILME